MSEKLNFEELSPQNAESISEFYCIRNEKDPTPSIFVDEFLRYEALNYHMHNVAKTHLLFHGENLAGYFTLFLDHISVNTMDLYNHQWIDFDTINQLNFPSIRIHALGAHQEYEGMGIGRHLILTAMQYCMNISEKAGCFFINVESYKSTEWFYDRYGFKTLTDENNKDDLLFMANSINDLKNP